MYIPDDIEMNITKRGVQPNGGGEIRLNIPNIKKLKAIQVSKIHFGRFIIRNRTNIGEMLIGYGLR